MSDLPLSFPAAAARLGVKPRILRSAIRAGKIPAPAALGALASISPEWIASVQEAATANTKLFSGIKKPKVPAFARYEGTSAWRKYTSRVRAFTAFRAA